MSIAGDSAAWPMVMSMDTRATVPTDMRESVEVAYTFPKRGRWAPPPPRPSLKMMAIWLVFAGAVVAAMYMSHGSVSMAKTEVRAR